MIDPKAQPIGHVSPYKRIDVRYPGRRRVITREEVLDNICREPCRGAYELDYATGNYILRE